MKDYDRIRTFINSYAYSDNPMIDKLYAEALKNDIPVIREDTREFLRLIIRMQKIEKVLEIGTATGFSSIFMAECIGDKADILTIEIGEEDYKKACDNIKTAGFEGRIKAVNEDAISYLAEHMGDASDYDLIFIDAAKAQYRKYLELCMPHTHKGSVIICDNIFLDGKVFESHFLVEKRDRTVHDRMRSFLEEIKRDEKLDTAILAIGDGVTVSYVL